jgi:hypothetical protein
VKEGKTFRRVLLHALGNLNFNINFGRAALGNTVMLTWAGDILLRYFVFKLGRLHGEAVAFKKQLLSQRKHIVSP